jgi:hypothetical protein
MATREMGGRLKKDGLRVICHTRMEDSLGDTLHTVDDDTWIIVLSNAASVLIFPRYLSVCTESNVCVRTLHAINITQS